MEMFFAFLETRPEFRRARDCRKALVGPMRRYLARHGGEAVAGLAALPPHAAALIAERQVAAQLLGDFCRRCGRCQNRQIFPPGIVP